jgi:sphingomyelin phosphodiesterase acid-like 3
MTFPSRLSPLGDATACGIDRRAFLRLVVSGGALLWAPAVFGDCPPAWGAQAGPGTQGSRISLSDADCPGGDPRSYSADRAEDAGMFLLFSDVHFDPFAAPAKVKALAAAPAGEWRAILSGSGSALSPYGRDTNDALFQSFLDDMARQAPRPDFLLYPGDLICHRFWSLYPRLSGDSSAEGLLAFIGKTVAYFLTEVSRRFPDAPLYLALGNNDSLEGDFRIAPQSPFLSITAPLVAKLALKDDTARPAFQDSYRQYGCYTAPLPGPGKGKIVVINNIFWAKKYPRQDAGRPVLDFLERELARAEQNRENVWLMAHVPPGDNAKASARKLLKTGEDVYAPLLADAWNSALAGLLVKFASTIKAGFGGHVHRDAFRLVYPGGGAMPAATMRLGPSISPVTGNNPGYQVYCYDKRSLELLDMTARYLDIGAASPAWATEYTYSQTYGGGLRSAKDWQAMYRGLLTCARRRQAFGEYFGLRSGRIDEVTERTFPIYWDSLGLSADFPNTSP